MNGFEPWIPLVLVALIVLASGFVQSSIGFGYGITALAMLPLVMDARSSHVLISASGIPVLAMGAWAWRGETDWSSLRWAMLGAILFMPIGFWLFSAMSLDLLVRATGVAIIVMVGLSLRKRSRETGSTSRKSSFAAGAVSGFLAGAVSIAGPPIAAFAMRQSWSQRKFKAFVMLCLMMIAMIRFAGLVGTGFVTREIFLLASGVAPFALVGVYLGAIATRKVHPDHFRRIVGISLLLVGCFLVYRGSPDAKGGHDSQDTTFAKPENTNKEWSAER